MMTLRSMASEMALRTRGSLTVSLASWKCQRCASSAGVSSTFTPGVPLRVWTMSGHTRSITWISPARRAAARVESSGMKRKVTFSTFGRPGFQYRGFAASSTRSPWIQLTNRNGPVPTGFWKNASSAPATLGGSMPSIVRCAGSEPNGRFVVTVTA